MRYEFGALIGLIGITCAVGVVCMSYVGAFMLGRVRGRAESDMGRGLDDRADARVDEADRLIMVESAVTSMAVAIERFADAQRMALGDRSQQARSQERLPAKLWSPTHNTPA